MLQHCLFGALDTFEHVLATFKVQATRLEVGFILCLLMSSYSEGSSISVLMRSIELQIQLICHSMSKSSPDQTEHRESEPMKFLSFGKHSRR